QADHSPHIEDAFIPPPARSVLPDDWDREFRSFAASAAAPEPAPAAPTPAVASPLVAPPGPGPRRAAGRDCSTAACAPTSARRVFDGNRPFGRGGSVSRLPARRRRRRSP